MPQILKYIIFAGIAIFAVHHIKKRITASILKKEIAKEFPNALKIKIKDKNTRRVNVGVFGKNDVEICEQSYKSKEGISDRIYVGQIISLEA